MMDRREFLKVGAIAVATVPFLTTENINAADVEIFVRNIEQSIDAHRLNQSSHLYINQFYHPSPMIWVWSPHGWTIQAQPVYYRSNLNFQGHLHGYHYLTQRRENIKQISIHNADCIYILEDGSIKIYDKIKKEITSSSKIPNYAAGLGRIDAHYRSRAR